MLGKQGLWPGRRWSDKAGTLAAIHAVENLQLDPLVILARSHDLMLHSRVIGYQPALFDEVAYTDRACFDSGGWLAVRPMDELPYWRTIMRRAATDGSFADTVAAHAEEIEVVRRALAERPTVSARDFDASHGKTVASYRGSKATSVALHYLWRTGEAMTHHREGFERIYAATESIAPAHLLACAAEDATDRFIALKGVAFAGIGRIGPLTYELGRPVTRAEELDLEHELTDLGAIVPVEVEGWRGRQFVLGADVPVLRDVVADVTPLAWAPIETSTVEEVTFLSPLDPVSARGRARALFGFDYVWEIYKRPADMKFGRYTMPILWGDQLVGRMDARMDRKANALVVNGLWLEDPATAKDAAFRAALRAGMRRLTMFLHAARVDASAVSNTRLRASLSAKR